MPSSETMMKSNSHLDTAISNEDLALLELVTLWQTLQADDPGNHQSRHLHTKRWVSYIVGVPTYRLHRVGLSL